MQKKFRIKTFPAGGVHVDECKFSAQRPIESLPLPGVVTTPVLQHFGAAATPIVKAGDRVKTGQVIAQANGFLSVNIHATIAGTVARIDEAMDVSGYKRPVIVINADGEDWVEGVDLSRTLKRKVELSSVEIIKKVQQDGLVGLGGAGFPVHVKLSPVAGKRADVLLINGAECEPYLTCDHRLMVEKGPEILVGVVILMKALNVSRAVIGIEWNKQDAIAHLSALASDFDGIDVVALKACYPQGAEKQLIEALIGKQVPIGGLPIDAGCVVQNIATAFAVYESIQKNKPLVERIVTVAGEDLKKPSNFRVRLGTSMAALIEAAGGLPESTGKIISGGPMMGKALNMLDIPVIKTTSGILVMPQERSKRDPVVNCIRCARCVKHCPLGLEPYLLMNLAEKERFEDAENEVVMNCCECGTCAYVCPAKRPLLDYIRLAKTFITQRRKEKAVK